MKTLLLASVLFATGTAATAAVAQPAAAVAASVLESRYPGKVVAIAYDDDGDKPAHWHVDLRFDDGTLARLDADASTLAVDARELDTPASRPVSLGYASARIATSMAGEVTKASLDSGNGIAPHYDIDVRLASGALARLKVDAKTGEIGWRQPAIVRD